MLRESHSVHRWHGSWSHVADSAYYPLLDIAVGTDGVLWATEGPRSPYLARKPPTIVFWSGTSWERVGGEGFRITTVGTIPVHLSHRREPYVWIPAERRWHPYKDITNLIDIGGTPTDGLWAIAEQPAGPSLPPYGNRIAFKTLTTGWTWVSGSGTSICGGTGVLCAHVGTNNQIWIRQA
ncbi:MAG: hypothetical protein JNM80_13300 [Phycisphaerae bacterium]|nr:hypothetical protein [Phycisphaerae bacterium]